MNLFFDTILVPQGAEYQAVCRGLERLKSTHKPEVLAIPMGVTALASFLHSREWQPQNILVMGLCGSLSSRHQVGDIVLYQDCLSFLGQHQYCDRQLTNFIDYRLPNKTSLVTSLTRDRLIWSASAKLDLAQKYQANVVDMEGFVLLDILGQQNLKVTMLRVVSDNVDRDIPDLNSAIAPSGKLQTRAMAIAMLKKPLAAIRLITGAIKGLKILQQTTTELFEGN